MIILYLYSSGIDQSEWTSKLAQTQIPELRGNGTLIPSFVHAAWHSSLSCGFLAKRSRKRDSATEFDPCQPSTCHPHAIYPNDPNVQLKTTAPSSWWHKLSPKRSEYASCTLQPSDPDGGAGFGLRNWWSSSQRCLKMKNGWNMLKPLTILALLRWLNCFMISWMTGAPISSASFSHQSMQLWRASRQQGWF